MKVNPNQAKQKRKFERQVNSRYFCLNVYGCEYCKMIDIPCYCLFLEYFLNFPNQISFLVLLTYS